MLVNTLWMNIGKKIRNQDFAGAAKRFLSVLLLAVYCCANIQVETFHNLLHVHKNAGPHPSAGEKDLCYKAIYLHDKSNGCGHTAHLAPAEKKCDLCPLVLQNVECVIPVFVWNDLTSDSEHSISPLVPQLFHQSTQLSPRAPPQA